jgi:hypothetical protein
MRKAACVCVCIRQHALAASAYVSIRQHTSAYVNMHRAAVDYLAAEIEIRARLTLD